MFTPSRILSEVQTDYEAKGGKVLITKKHEQWMLRLIFKLIKSLIKSYGCGPVLDYIEIFFGREMREERARKDELDAVQIALLVDAGHSRQCAALQVTYKHTCSCQLKAGEANDGAGD